MKICVAGSSGHSGRMLQESLKIPGIEVSGYCPGEEGESVSSLGERIARFGYPGIRGYDTLEEMLCLEKPDVVIVDGAFRNHGSFICTALEHGASVLSEKPLALSLEELSRVEKAVDSTSAQLWAMQTLRYEPWTLEAKRLIRAGAVGEIRLLSGQKSYRFGKRGDFYRHRDQYGGTIPWVAIHAIDAFRYLCPLPVHTIFARHSRGANRGYGDLEMTAVCMFEMEGGVLATATADFLRPETAATHGDDRVRVAGTKGVLEILHEKVYLINPDSDGTEPIKLPEQPGPTLIEDFLNAVQGKPSGLLDTKQSIESTRLALLARESADCGKVITI